MLSIYCRCGAQWHKRFAENNINIVMHANGQSRPQCHLIDHQTYVGLFGRKCQCEECKNSRRRKPRSQPVAV